MQHLIILDRLGVHILKLRLESRVRSIARSTGQSSGDGDGRTTPVGLRQDGEVVAVGAAFGLVVVDWEVFEFGDDGLSPSINIASAGGGMVGGG
jgi:hypothetical protein